MFEKEAEEWVIDSVCKDCSRYEKCKSKEYCTCKECSKEKWQNGAEFGYNKCKEEINQNGLALQSDMDKTIELNIALKDKIVELEKENAELKAQIEKMKVQHFTDIRLYTKVIGIAVEESVMKDKQNYKNYLFDKAKKILSMGVDK